MRSKEESPFWAAFSRISLKIFKRLLPQAFVSVKPAK
jgi:hypothetical protein